MYHYNWTDTKENNEFEQNHSNFYLKKGIDEKTYYDNTMWSIPLGIWLNGTSK